MKRQSQSCSSFPKCFFSGRAEEGKKAFELLSEHLVRRLTLSSWVLPGALSAACRSCS